MKSNVVRIYELSFFSISSVSEISISDESKKWISVP